MEGNVRLNSLLSPSVQELAWKDSLAVKLAVETPGDLSSLRFELLLTHWISPAATAWIPRPGLGVLPPTEEEEEVEVLL